LAGRPMRGPNLGAAMACGDTMVGAICGWPIWSRIFESVIYRQNFKKCCLEMYKYILDPIFVPLNPMIFSHCCYMYLYIGT
jgi:hypothetical protein